MIFALNLENFGANKGGEDLERRDQYFENGS